MLLYDVFDVREYLAADGSSPLREVVQRSERSGRSESRDRNYSHGSGQPL